MPNPRILWADDEIELLRPHILFLEAKGYDVTSVSNGSDAAERAQNERFDVIFLDEQMPGMGGLEALELIKTARPETPVVMITKSEEEYLMEDAIGRQIADYLIKPVNPKQLLLTCKRLLEGTRIREERVSQDYLKAFAEIGVRLGGDLDHKEWVETYQDLVRHERELEGSEEGVRQILHDQYREANASFGRFIESEYPSWIKDLSVDTRSSGRGTSLLETGDRPVLSPEVLPRFVFPHLEGERPVVFMLIDCMRFDQWLEFERLLYPFFEMERGWHYSILPTATPFSRNSIFSGLLPIEIARRYQKYWRAAERDEESSRNQHEEEMLLDLLQRKHKQVRTRYAKLISSDDGQQFADKISDYTQQDFSAVVVNFVDILTHSRSDSDVLRQIAPDTSAFRALTRTWFERSWLFAAFQELAELGATVIVTTDHGAVRSLHATKVIGDRETSTSLRYKYGRNLKCDERHAIYVKDPEEYGLPRSGLNENYIFAKEDYYFVYPTNYNRYLNMYNDTFQHGGVSMEEVILPVATLTPRAS
ncbi:response regulator [soil metagenome]